jgi:hypothetical protein
MSLGINTDNFYKYITTLSLASTIYFFSFDQSHTIPLNKHMTNTNLSIAELAADIGFLKGEILDYKELKTDSYNTIDYCYHHDNDSSEVISYFIQNNYALSNEEITKYNDINYEYAKRVFKLKVIKDSRKSIIKNYRIRTWAFMIFGTISFVIFITSLFFWYKNRNEFDK